MMFIMRYGLNWMKVVEEDMTKNCSRDDLDLTAENCETHFLQRHFIDSGIVNTFKMPLSS